MNRVLNAVPGITGRLYTKPSLSDKLDFTPGKLQFKDPSAHFAIIAHRGASAYAPENTMPAFQKALQMGANMIELDILPSSDLVPMVIHDAALKRTTNGNGHVMDFTAVELMQLDAGYWFSPEFEGTSIPKLSELLEWAAGKIALNIEIKKEAVTDQLSGSVTEAALNLVKEYGMEHQVVFSSFDFRAIRQIKNAEPGIICHLLYSRQQVREPGLTDLLNSYNADGINLKPGQLFPQWLAEAKRSGAEVWVYTVNDPDQMRYLVKKGVTGIFTDKPDLLRSVVNNLPRDGSEK